METQNPFEIIDGRLSQMEETLSEIRDYQIKNRHTKEEEDVLLDVSEASVFLKYKIPTIYSKVSKRELPHIKKGKLLKFSKKALTEWLLSGSRKTINDFDIEAEKRLNKKAL